MKLIFVILFYLAFIVNSHAKAVFKVSFGEHNYPPYAIIEKGRLVSGIIKDINDAITEKLSVDIEYVYLPRKRQVRALFSEKIDAIAISNPNWVEDKTKFLWSEPLFVEYNILVTAQKNNLTINKFSDLKGMTVGTLRGYFYPTLEKAFAQKQLLRSDVSRLDLNFSRLSKGWIDSFVDSHITINYHLQRIEQPEQYKISSLVISEHNIHSALSANSNVSVKQYNKTLIALKKAGVIDDILKKYQPLP